MTIAAPISKRRAILGWSLYDLANTIFFLLVVTRYLPVQMAQLAGNESAIAWTNVAAMAASALLSPALGALVDRAGRARSLTFAITAVCCLATAAMGAASSALALGLTYIVARFAYELASVPYNALLPSLAGSGTSGHVSGIGVALGYVGNLFAFALILAFGLDKSGFGPIYVLAAVLFFLFTLPLRLWVPEIGATKPGAVSAGALLEATRATWRALCRQFADPARRDYFVGTLLVCDPVNTVLVQVARYAAQPAGLGLDDDGVTKFLMAVQVSAIAGGFLFGKASDRIGGRRATLIATLAFGFGIAAAQFLPGFWLRTVAMGAFGGAGIAGIWSAGRQWLLRLVPHDEIGEAFGFYGLAQRASLFTLFPFTLLFDRYRNYGASVGVLLLFVVAGFWRLSKVPRHRS